PAPGRAGCCWGAGWGQARGAEGAGVGCPGAMAGGGRAEEAAGPEEAMERLAAALRQRLRGWEAALAAAQRLLVWERPLLSLVTAGGLGG
uniref:Uncharacterized protein n=1 Tax=Gopherus agassizii TaxID=38772 RepID=A0A452H1L2_9SAUR